MSNIYIQEPPTIGKVLLKTTVGDIDVELWSKETPKACRNFVQLCMEGYYDGTIFHRVVPEFIAQGGDPTGSGHGGESVYGAPFKDEFHTRLRFNRRGLVAMANSGPNDNGSQFFFTLGAATELQNKHTIFGKIVGDTIYNMIKLQDCEIDSNERPLYPHKIIKTQILSNPFDDIVPRAIKRKSKSEEEKKPKSKSKATKNFKLLSFGEEAEEEEHAIDKAAESMRGKSKSSHDLTNDPKLSSVPAVDTEVAKPKKAEKEGKRSLSDDEEEGELDGISQEELEKVRDRLKKKIKKEEKMIKADDGVNEEMDEKKKKREELKEEAKKLQRELAEAKKKDSTQTTDPSPVSQAEEKPKKKESETNALAEFRQERQKYKELRRQQQHKGHGREEMTMALLAKFQDKLSSVRKATVDYSDDEEEDEKKEEEEDEDATDLSWMNHTLKFDEHERKVLDANVTDADRYEIFDPRNPITKRRRENSKKTMNEKR